ncbi:MAG: carboxypeptidase regulatory-like domain-containing protein, partial [Acidimicrobiia bacterium]|nr:carboxypeptidase regulatory-like domain-containing protein [Acidimicrobiia bacterium]
VTNTGQTDLFDLVVADPLSPNCDATIATLPIGESTSYLCSSDPVAGDFTNIANVTAEDALGGSWTDLDPGDVDLVDPGLAISKTPNLQTLLSGETATFEITVTNTGDIDLDNVDVLDPLAPDCDNPIGTLAAGESVTYVCTRPNVTVDFTNTVTVTADNPLGGIITVSDTATVDVVFPGVDIQKTPDSQQVLVDDLVTFTITVTNSGDQDLIGLMVSDPLSPTCDSGPFGLVVGASTSYTCSVTVTADFTNIASVAGTDALANPVSDSDDAAVDAINPSIAISATPDTQTVIYGGTATFTIEVTNTGDSVLTDVMVTDPSAPACDTTIASLAVGETVTYTCTVNNVTGDFTSTAVVTATDPLDNEVTGSDTAAVVVLVPGIEIQKSPDFQQVLVGADATFTIAVTNTGETFLSNVIVSDPLAPACGRIVGSLAISATTTYTCTVTVGADFTNTVNVTASDPLGNPWADSDIADVDAIAPGLAVTKSPDVQSVPLGDDATFVIEVTNTGDVDLTDVSLVDAFVPACDTTIASLLVGESVSYNCVVAVTGDFTNTIVASGLDPNLDPVDGGNDSADVTVLLPGVLVEKVASQTAIGIGQDATFTITITNTGDVTLTTVDVVDAAYPACDNTVGPLAPNASTSYVCTVADVLVGFTNTVDASALDGNGNSATSSDSESITVLPASIAITKVADAGTVVDGGDITYTITVENDGPADLVAVSVSDPTLPACDNAFATLLAGDSQTYTCVLAGVDATTADPVVNTISVTAQDEAGDDVVDSDTESVDVLVPELSIFKTADTPTVLENGTATFSITVINTGETALDTVTITDVAFPACDGVYPTLAIAEVQSYSCDVVGVMADFTNTVTAAAVDPIGGSVTATDSASVTVIQTGDLGGFVFTDENGDGVFNPADGDAPIANVDVVLTGVSGPPVTVVTDGSGLYSATLPIGDYSVDVDETDVDFPVGYGNETTGTDGQTVTVDDTVPVTAADIGYAPAGDIVGTVWEDANGDGLQDLGEAGRPGVAVNLWVDTDSNGSPDTVVASTTTDANGDYFFIGIADGTYAVEVIASDISPMDIGGDDSIDSDIDPVTGLSGPASVLPGSQVDLDAGVYVPVSVGDLVYIDLNGDGVRDVGEPGFGGIVVTATNTSSGTVFTTTSDSTGAYSFSLPPGNYDIAVAEPVGTSVTTANDPTNLTLVSGDIVDTVDFGIDAVG